ncbi:hypothetical protein LJC34_07620 [Oscillospiraceae bacterium OttesenSCG-928-G22]|nr:hypothetical protein [Oscillospiraceae bacterium OttesenSCG-928-G22]
MLPLIKLRYFRYPELIKSIETRHMRYNESLDLVAREAENGTALVLRPSVPVTVGRLEKDFGKLRALYESGYHDASNRLAEIRRFFAPESA